MKRGPYKNRRPIADRLWEKVDKNGPVPPHRPELGPCWVWTASMMHQGYGKIGEPGGARWLRAHRVSWELEHGPVPDGLWVLHKCDNPPCVRPDHLFLGDGIDNARDMASKGRNRFEVKPGESNPAAKLTADDVRVIRAEYARGGVTGADLARRFGVSKEHVYRIRDGANWAGI